MKAYSPDIGAIVVSAPVTYPKTPKKLKQTEIQEDFEEKGYAYVISL